jgi:hypothetical protein
VSEIIKNTSVLIEITETTNVMIEVAHNEVDVTLDLKFAADPKDGLLRLGPRGARLLAKLLLEHAKQVDVEEENKKMVIEVAHNEGKYRRD